jgi:REP element-mobilizing transposase RayT
MSENLRQLIAGKLQWTEPLSDAEVEKGFKGWYGSKHLPHFDAPGTQQFITYRLADAMPAARRSEWEAFLHLEDKLEKQRKIEAYIDRGYGDCSLREPRIAQVVQDNLFHHDGVKYRLLAWCIMPNHVHTLIELGQTPLSEILKSWNSYTAKQANRLLHRAGTFWEEDYFDHYIRDEKHFRQVVRYIEANPVKARLARAPNARSDASRFPLQRALGHSSEQLDPDHD